MDSLRKQPSLRRTRRLATRQHPQPSVTPPPQRSAPPRQSHDGEKPKHQKIKRVFLFVMSIFLLSIISLVVFITFRVIRTTQTITVPQMSQHTDDQQSPETPRSTLTQLAQASDETILKGYDMGRINILLLGIAGTQKPGAMLTDTIMLASIDVVNHTVALLSIPRDLIITTEKNIPKKINRLFADGRIEGVGADRIIQSVEKITNQDVHYFIVMDFEGFIRVIDALGGINIDVPHDIHDTHYPGPGYSYETFDLSAGLHHLDGATALKYARSRHSDPESDFGRAKRQQQVLRSTRNKAFTLGTITNPFTITSILDAIEDHLVTNISTKEIKAFIALVHNLDTQNITTVVLDAWKPHSLLRSVRRGRIAGLMPRSGTWDEIRDLATNIFSRDKIAQRRARLIAEDASVLLLNASGDASLTKNLQSYLTSRGIENLTTKEATHATTTRPDTIIYDHTQDRFTYSLDELLTQLHGTRTTDTQDVFTHPDLTHADRSYDIIVILGKDLLEQFGYQEISQQEIEKEYNKE